MDSKELRGLYEAYSEVYVSQEKKENTEVVDEGKLPLDKERRDRIGRQIGRRTYSSSPKKYDQMDKMSGALKSAQKTQNNEEFDIFDVVLEFLQVEGYAETLEEAEWIMANMIDEEAISIVLGEAQEARNNPEKYEREQSKKSAPVRGERTPMPPRGDKRREDFEKWYAKQMGR
jgi:hypothetical protein